MGHVKEILEKDGYAAIVLYLDTDKNEETIVKESKVEYVKGEGLVLEKPELEDSLLFKKYFLFQKLKLNKDIELLDTPGILMPKFDNQEIGKKLSLIGSIKDDITPLDDVSLYLIELLKHNYLENLNNLYKINVTSEDENVFIMEKVAEKRFKKIGGDYDYDSTIKLLIQDFRTQKFGLITLDNYSDLLENEEQNEN